jgi:PAS domain S-box-containing protein
MRAHAEGIQPDLRGAELMRRIIEFAPHAIIATAADGRIMLVNVEAERLFGYARAELIGQPVELLIPAALGRAHAEYRRAFAADPRARRMGAGRELFAVRKDGAEVPVEIGLAPITTDEGTLVLAFIADITERKTADAMQARLAAIVESSEDAIISKSLAGVITSWNRAAETMYGYAAAEALGQPLTMLVPPEHQAAEAELLARLRAGEGAQHYETQRLRKDGRRIDVAITVSPLRDRAGRVVGGSKIARDITERKREQEELRRLSAELAQRVEQRTAELAAANRELEAFSYTISHDLRAPLRHVTSFVELLGKHAGAQLDEKGQRYLRIIAEAGRHMADMIEDLLTLSRLGRSAFSEARVDLNELVEAVRAELAGEAAGRAVTWEVARLPAVRGDVLMLRSALGNLLGNALKYTRPRDPARIEIGMTQQAGEPALFVRDNGVGFDPQFAGKLFGVFQRLHRAEEFEGTGIGLASVRRVIERHGGRIWAESTPDQGATFAFTLPGRFIGDA